MLAMVTQTFALDIFENEQVRRRKEGRAPVSRIQFREVWTGQRRRGVQNQGRATCLWPFGLLSHLLLSHNAISSQFSRIGLLVVTESQLTEEDGKAWRECPSGEVYKPAAELAEACDDRILYLWKDWRNDKIVKVRVEKKLDVLILANGFNFGHLDHALAYAQVALVMIERLSFAGLLLSLVLVHWKITSRGLVAQQQLMMQGREATLYVDRPNSQQAWYRRRLLGPWRAPPAFKHPTGLIYLGRPDRITCFGGEFFYVCTGCPI